MKKKTWRFTAAAAAAGLVFSMSGSIACMADEVPQADPDKTYDISYTGYWCNADYEDGSYVETMIEDALNVDITVEKAETSDTIDLLLASGEMPDCMWTETKTAAWMYEQELARPIPPCDGGILLPRFDRTVR